MVQGIQIIKYDSNGRVREHAAHAHTDSRGALYALVCIVCVASYGEVTGIL